LARTTVKVTFEIGSVLRRREFNHHTPLPLALKKEDGDKKTKSFQNYTVKYNTFGYNFVSLQRAKHKAL